MPTAEIAAAKLLELLKDQNPVQAAPNALFVDSLAAVLRVRVLQEQVRGPAALVVTEVAAVFQNVDAQITITCVGFAAGLEAACGLAMGQWVLGVLPVLQVWRGQHTCLAGDGEESIAGHGGERLKLIRGPVIELGEHTGEQKPSMDDYSSALRAPLENKSLRRRLHWVECYAVRTPDGFDATCRLDNRDWQVGKDALISLAKTWPGQTESMHSRRQFMMLVPQGDGPYEKAPGFWGRLFGKS